jgi:hypothetical protein
MMNMNMSNFSSKRESLFTWGSLFIVLVAITILLTRQFWNPHLGYPDADRILMDGVFIHDFLRDLPLTNIYDYTINYYAQYPALSIGYRPPFFPFVEAIFNTAFGVNMWSSRLAILAFAVVGFSAWFFLVRRIFNTSTALASCLLLISLPFISKWGWYTMGELPLLSMAMLTCYLFYRYVETDKARFLFGCALSFVLAVWTKQTAFYLAFWFLLYLIYDKSLLMRLKQGKVWIAVALITAALIPLALITLWLGDQNLAQSVGTAATQGASPWTQRLLRLPEHFDNILNYQTTLPFIVLTLAGMFLSVIKGDRKTIFFWLFILATVLFFSYVIHKNERYSIFWLPAFSLFAAYPLYLLREFYFPRYAFALVLTIAFSYNVYSIYKVEPNYATGYQEAAQFVLENSSSPTVFVDAYNNGYFTYFMRAHDDARSMYVLRADKLLASSSISAKNRLELHAQNKKEILEILGKYGIELIVVESQDISGVEIYKEFRELLQNGPFSLIKRIPVETTRPVLDDQELLIYRYLERKPIAGNTLTLHLPVVGQTIEVPLRELINEDKEDVNQ